jgi:hypothetical protein
MLLSKYLNYVKITLFTPSLTLPPRGGGAGWGGFSSFEGDVAVMKHYVENGKEDGVISKNLKTFSPFSKLDILWNVIVCTVSHG